MVQRQVDRWPDTDSKRKFSATKTIVKAEVKQIRNVLPNPKFGFTKRLGAPAAPSERSEHPRSDFGDPGLDERDGKVGIAGTVISTEQAMATAPIDSGAASRRQSSAVRDGEQASYPTTLHEPHHPRSRSCAHSRQTSE